MRLADVFFKREENNEKKWMPMKEVRRYTGLSKSYLYDLKDKGILQAEKEMLMGQPRYKFLTQSVMELIASREGYLKEKSKLENEEAKTVGKHLMELRRYLYGN